MKTSKQLFYAGLLSAGILSSCTKPHHAHKLKTFSLTDDKKQIELMFQDSDKLILSVSQFVHSHTGKISYMGSNKDLVIKDGNDNAVYYIDCSDPQSGDPMFQLAQNFPSDANGDYCLETAQCQNTKKTGFNYDFSK